MPKNRDKWNKAIKQRMEKNKSELIGHLRKMPILQIAIERTQLSRSTYYNWRDEDEQFRKDADAAITEGEALITDMSESQLIALIRDKHFPALHLWLRQHHPKYKEKIEITGNLVHERRELTDEEKKLREAAIRLGLPKNISPEEPQ